MTRWILAVGAVLALLGVLLYQVLGGADSRVDKVRIDAGATASRDDADVRPRDRSGDPEPVADAGNGAGADRPRLISDTSAEFSHRIDVVIPNKFRARASKCYAGGGDGDRKLKVNYRLRIIDGMVSATDIRVKESTIGDPALEKCLLESVSDMRYRAEDMPDFQEDGELFIRLRSLKKYKSVEDQIKQKERNQIIDGDGEAAPETE